MRERCLETKTEFVKANSEQYKYLNELNKIMNKNGIHRIYRVINKNNEFHEAHQCLDVNKCSTRFCRICSTFIKNYLPGIYFGCILKFRVFKYRIRLKRFMDKHNIESITTTCISLYQGIYISKNQLCVSGVNIVYKPDNDGTQRVKYIDKAYLDI